ncbi:putative circadian clock protein, KaiC [Haladaptatus paucihalophilus DX253]|uniref:KaiC domain protein, AF_0351 family n=1 Tax=Haladaptatus paucihalophilus DX253 TaxID=797209 RepID=E7QNN9_HALPU|nr:KaiC domain-containing protein [Haladaptatus paucihalophilus]EFW94156.1 putative circadian clock protein, KaiC [Haladaptatus paucihalophilus DX253]SHK60044.1 KaiC domain protein, AF_0351 family [Haladaptatus paucihalophilus DX253]
MSDDDDWFEAALRDDEESDDEESVSKESVDRKADGTEADSDADENAVEGNATDDAPDTGDDPLFEDDFASAFASAPGAGGGSEPDFDGGDGFDGGEFGGGGFDDGFGGEGGFDAGGFGGGGSSFDDEAFESAIPRIDIGIDGLDSMIHGGVPERTLMVAIGNAGTGKTTFGLQFLNHALSNGEKAVYVTLEESHERIVASATEKGWPYDEYVEKDRLAVVDLDPIEMANSLSSIRSELPGLVRDFGASRLVLDSVSLLEMMYQGQATRRNEIYDFTRSLKEAGVTTMLTSEASDENPYSSRHGIIEYLTDAVFVLRYVRSTDDFRETRLAIEIQKIRDANHSREIKPYDITNEGISVYQQANLF